MQLLPFKERSSVEFELNRVEDIKRFGEIVDFYVPFSPGYLSIALNTQSYLSIEQILSLKLFLIHTRTLKTKFGKSAIKDYFSRLHEYNDILKEIDSRIDDDKELKDSASPMLYKIRIRKKGVKHRIKEILREFLTRRPYLFTDLNIVERNSRYVLPVKSNFKNEIPGIVHAYSNTGETLFIEPIETTELNAELVELENREKHEIEIVLRLLTNIIRTRIDNIEDDINQIVDLDVLFAKARYANELNSTKPIFGDYLNISEAYHPILKRLKDVVVPLMLRMEPDKRVLLISGPNAGGKTVVLKTVGIISLMAKCGLFIPAAEGTILPFFEEIYADIGDEQSLESDLSTFAGHLKHINDALHSNNSSSLVLLDELMNQTSVEEGSALAAAVLEEFSRKRDTVLATTHNESLKIFVSKRKDMLNAGMEFTDRPTYRLILGVPQPSNALKLASQMGISDHIIQKAISYLDKDKLSLNEMFEDLSKELKSIQEERQKLSLLINEYEANLQSLKSKKKRELDELQERYKKELIQAKRTIERLIKTIKKEGPKPEIVQEAKKFFEEKLKDEETKKPYFPHIGEIVKIRGMEKGGKVITERQGKYKLCLDNIFFWVEPTEIEPISEQ